MSRTTITIVIGQTRWSAPTPASAMTTTIASGPYATEVSVSSERAERPSTGEIRSLMVSEMRSGRPTRTRQIDANAAAGALRSSAMALIVRVGGDRDETHFSVVNYPSGSAADRRR